MKTRIAAISSSFLRSGGFPKRCSSRVLLCSLALIQGVAGSASAALISVFAYDADASTTTGSTPSTLAAGAAITDVSTGGNNGAVIGTTVSTVEDDPFGVAGQLSFSFSSGPDNRINTNAIDLLTVANVAASGGYTMSTHVKTGQVTGFGQLFAYAGTDGFRTQNAVFQFITSSNGGPTGGMVVDLNALHGSSLQDNNWHEVTAAFDSLGNGVVSGQVQGQFTFTIDGTSYAPIAGAFDDFGESLNRPIGVGGRSAGGDQFNGLIYNPSVSLGQGQAPSCAATQTLLVGQSWSASRQASTPGCPMEPATTFVSSRPFP